MPITKLAAGETIETASASEIGHLLHPIHRELAKLTAQSDVMVIGTSTSVVAGGLLGPLVIYDVPVGRMATIHRITVDSGSATPLAPIAAGWLRVGRDGVDPSQLCYFLPVAGSTAIAPAVITEGSDSAVVLRSGQTLQVSGAGLAVGVNLSFSVQVELWPHQSPPGQANYNV